MTEEDPSIKGSPEGRRDGLFISYRRDDARGASGRLYDWLRIAFGRDKVFRDVASIGPGKWRQRIDQALARSIVCLPVIGPRWRDAQNGPRLAEDGDMVRHELLTALADQELTLIPTLVEGAAVPPQNKLPAELHALLEWNAFPLSEQGWEDDIRRLLAAVAQCSGQAVAGDVDSLLEKSREAESRCRELEHEKKLQADQIKALNDTIAALTRQMADSPANKRSELSTALADLARGETSAAEVEFEKVLQQQSAVVHKAGHEAAEAARNIANLALLGDIDKAIRYYRRACDLEPGLAESWRLLGHACLTAGDSGTAREAMTRAAHLAESAGDAWGEMAAKRGQGDVATALGRLADAASFYRAAMLLAGALAAEEPGNLQRQRDLSINHDRIGDVLLAQGDGPAALTAYRNSLTVARTLAGSDPANPQWQRDLSVIYIKIGDVLVTQGERPEALSTYRQGLTIAESLATRDPANSQWQRDLSVSHERVGDLLLTQGDGPGALLAYRTSLSIREALGGRDPANAQWQRDLSISQNKIGDVLLAQGDGTAALAAYTKGLNIAERLAARDPANTTWQRDLALSHNNIGTVLTTQNDRSGALAAFRKGLAIAEALALLEPTNTQWQSDLSISHVNVGDVLVADGDNDGAMTAYQKSLSIMASLVARDPLNTEWQRDLSVSHNKMGDVLANQGNRPAALDAYRLGLSIAETLVALDSASTEWQRDSMVGHIKMGDVLAAQGNTQDALAAYGKSLGIAEALANCDRDNAQWQVDIAESCIKISELPGADKASQSAYRQRGLNILRALRDAGRLLPNQDDGTGWFNRAMLEMSNDA